MGILWPNLMGTFGAVFGFPFALEGVAFFVEAIFLGIYLYGWDRLPPRVHFLTGIPVAAGGLASAFFVVTANAWMNEPRGFDLSNGTVINTDPIAAMFNPATWVESAHMILAAFMVSGFTVAAVYAWGMLRGRDDRYHRCGFAIPFLVAALVTPVQIGVGDWAARFVAEHQPVKLAAMEAQYPTVNGAPEHIGGVVIDGQLRGALEIPHALSLLIAGDPNARVQGLDSVAVDQQPAVNVVHLSFQVMVGIGTALLALALWGLIAGRGRRLPRSRWFFRAAVLAGPAVVVAMEAGWIVTEVGRQPWIVYHVMRTRDAVNPAPGLIAGVFILVAVYSVLSVAAVLILRRIAGRPPSSARVVGGID
jgi:cytochrome d ubiquinol oxidase subunit I